MSDDKDRFLSGIGRAAEAVSGTPRDETDFAMIAEQSQNDFFDWCALHGLGLQGWPNGAWGQLQGRLLDMARAAQSALADRVKRAEEERDAMQRRAESAERDWKAAEAEVARLREALSQAYYALATDGEDDAGYNLQGALDDLICKDTDGATQRTIERVLKQIISTQDILSGARHAATAAQSPEPTDV